MEFIFTRGRQVASARILLGISQKQLADGSNITLSDVRLIEKDKEAGEGTEMILQFLRKSGLELCDNGAIYVHAVD